MLLFCGLLILLVGLLAALNIHHPGESEDETEPQEQTGQPAPELPREVAPDEIKEQLVGRSEQEVKNHLGLPSSTDSSPSGGGATELWYYERPNGKLKITL